MDADVISIETSRSDMELLAAFGDFAYPDEIGPGIWDIHSPRIPSEEDIVGLLRKAMATIPAERFWVNPDCGLKTRGWAEVKLAIRAMVAAAPRLRAETRGQRVGPLVRLAGAAVEIEDRPRDARHVGGELAELHQRRAVPVLGQGGPQVGHEPRLLAFGEELDVQPEDGVELEEDRSGQRPLVLLDLVQ